MIILISDFMALFFYIFSGFIILSSIGVVASRNAVYSVLWLILAFCNAAGLFVLIGAEFLAMTLIVVYVGAVAVLFLFVVMMLGSSLQEIKQDIKQNFWLSIMLLAFLVFDLSLVILSSTHNMDLIVSRSLYSTSDSVINIVAIGSVLYTDFILPFQVSGLILFAAMISCIILTLRARTGVRRQKSSEQLARDKNSGMEVVEVKYNQGVRGIKYE